MAPGPDAKAAVVTPQPGLPRTIGFLNLLFGGMLFLCGLGCLGYVAPMLAPLQPLRLDPDEAQFSFDNLKQSLIVMLQEREQKATTDAEKEKIKKRRIDLQALHPRIGDQLDLKTINHDLRWLTWYLWADVVTAPVLNLLMLTSGIGLIQLRGWARTMGLYVAAGKLLRLAVLTIFLIAGVIPHLSRTSEVMMASDFGKLLIIGAEAQQQAQQGAENPAAQIDPKDLVPIMRAMGYISAILMLGFGAIYPVLTLAVLSRPAARAACSDPDADSEEQDGDHT